MCSNKLVGYKATLFFIQGLDTTPTLQNGLSSNGSTNQQPRNRFSVPKINPQGSINRRPEYCDTHMDGVQSELRGILREIRVITDKIRAEV